MFFFKSLKFIALFQFSINSFQISKIFMDSRTSVTYLPIGAWCLSVPSACWCPVMPRAHKYSRNFTPTFLFCWYFVCPVFGWWYQYFVCLMPANKAMKNSGTCKIHSFWGFLLLSESTCTLAVLHRKHCSCAELCIKTVGLIIWVWDLLHRHSYGATYGKFLRNA